MINAHSISLMKDRVYLLNTARGSLVDTAALLKGLKTGKIAGVGLDTYENESPLFNRDLRGKEIADPMYKDLISLDNVLVTPRVSFDTDTSVKNMVRAIR